MNKYIVFDWDGTLHNTKKLYAESVRRAYSFLEEKGIVEGECPYSDDYFSKYLGMTAKDMWADFMPGLDADIQKQAEGIVGNAMVELTRDGKAVLYEGAMDTLKQLKNQGFNMMILSNCKIAYLNAHIDYWNLDDLFTAYYPAEQYDFIPKEDILKEAMTHFPGEYVMVGDRYLDIQAGKRCGVKTIGCAYGFGSMSELADADYIIQDIREMSQGDVVYSSFSG